MKIAVVPIELNWLIDRTYPDKWIRLKDIERILKDRGDDSWIKLISKKEDLIDADWIVFMGWYSWSYKWYNEVLNNDLLDKTVYWMQEPEVVNIQHSKQGISFFLKKFKYVMTWNKELIDSSRVFKLNIPYDWKQDVSEGVFSERQDNRVLLTNISANKSSSVKGELYSERERVIKWFDERHPDDIIFYGNGWGNSGYTSYGGICGDKKDVYQKFKFALSLENVSKEDYLTEKLIDCLTAGIVPIYKGATNVTEYIPKECFIDFDKFSSIEELYLYIKNMPDSDYMCYIDRIKNFVLNTKEIRSFSAEEWIKCFDILAKANNNNPKMVITFKDKVKFKVGYSVFKVKLFLHYIKNKLSA